MTIYISPLISNERFSEIFNELRNLFDDITYYTSGIKFCCYQRKVGIMKVLEYISKMEGVRCFSIDDIKEDFKEQDLDEM